MRSVDLSGLPRDARHFIAWNQSEGFDIPFHYDDQQGLLTILRAEKGNHGESVLDIRYAGRIIPAVPASSVKYCFGTACNNYRRRARLPPRRQRQQLSTLFS